MDRAVKFFGISAAVLAFLLWSMVPAGAQEEGIKVYYKDGFKMESADKAFKIHWGGRIQTDLRVPESDHPATSNFKIRAARLEAEGTFYENYGFKVQYDLGGGKASLKDAYVKVDYRPDLNFKMGQYKVPFSLEELTSLRYVDFVERTMIVTAVAPSRDIGFMVDGKLFDKALYYGIGVFNGAGAEKENDSDEMELAGRVAVSPFHKSEDSPLKKLTLAGNVTFTDRPSGAKSFKGKSASGVTFFPQVSTNGDRVRYGADLAWLYKSFSLKSEYLLGRENRDGLAAGGADYPELETKGWYVTGTWLITGQERKPSRNEGVEAAVRYEEVEFDDDSGPVVKTEASALTLGLNWYINKMTVVRLDYILEDYENPAASAGLADDTANIFMGRFQMEF